MSAIRRYSAIAIILLFALPTPPVAASTLDGAVTFVQNLGDNAIEVLKDPDTSPEQRRAEFRALLDRGFAVKTIGRFALGRYWRAATPEQQQEYLRLFRLFVLHTYASRFDGYSGQSFNVVKAHPIDDKDTLVNTEIWQANAEPLRVDYRVRVHQGDYKIVDVLVEGISLIRTQRSEFASIINRDGIDGLLALLRGYDHTSASN
jgi:phospholipid transport system substrate-binding protein